MKDNELKNEYNHQPNTCLKIKTLLTSYLRIIAFLKKNFHLYLNKLLMIHHY